ncbi:MAG TPA: bifunctional phosphopantothenoylcysteine decarboxylase/phosphopantothenate--cysteine ligase CoaBC [Nitrospirales bacterium]|nr:bifunctional phosphopantothenoylcysteine decarboxylase/phosphopantothenate--cysteine ligase CoaBC [Nitrospirales bacterium]HIC04920.1 bifunctional phosphopantothenoylcysteine decarboxylase/phosphopantothenate--cysteine ligase CoaBC [Nitrospirales bacterium]HIO21368.1 bifunctional phosphopantothenoylcysteine decarboxylase/phosphopantothenate--cysteine ligase CoaBC [Nitrospirales bacterium]HIO69490.1 bifunctional phosphopantothenoylcysteine decarboxylase/phosphopantothenate--cysteine ligase Coa
MPVTKKQLSGKRVVFGVGGSIAAYKAILLLRRLTDLGADVEVVMTTSACEFITPLTFQTLSGHPVHTNTFNPDDNMAHLRLAENADLILVSPATANLIGRFAQGMADDLLSTIILASHAPLLVVPAMDGGMWQHPLVQQNVKTLRETGVEILDPEFGSLASGHIGWGRFPSEEAIMSSIISLLTMPGDYHDEVVLITAGPTHEAIDPVRYIANRSSGKMGYALAQAAQKRGAQMVLVTGPTSLTPPPGIHTISVTTAEEMRDAVHKHFERATVVIMAAAVADYRPDQPAKTKLKKQGREQVSLALSPTPDILTSLSAQKSGQFMVGFAAETEHLIEEATRKLKAKGLDMIVANDVTKPGAGFGSDTNAAVVLDAHGLVADLPLMPKCEMATKLLDLIRIRLNQQK